VGAESRFLAFARNERKKDNGNGKSKSKCKCKCNSKSNGNGKSKCKCGGPSFAMLSQDDRQDPFRMASED
jgi:hypothetical protein